jgi:hypothetical protein
MSGLRVSVGETLLMSAYDGGSSLAPNMRQRQHLQYFVFYSYNRYVAMKQKH